MSSMNESRGSCILYLEADGMKMVKRCIVNVLNWGQRNTLCQTSATWSTSLIQVPNVGSRRSDSG
jgi:hypothetical protein